MHQVKTKRQSVTWLLIKKTKMATKEIKGMTDQEIMERIQAEKADLNKLTLNHTISPVENPAKIRVARRNIAKMLTEVNNRKKAAK